ncbi:OTU domain-containing protein 4 isoform X2 [Danio aesculapii]|uniref:OTU domain-containing protein 4 isoform X2 n=1 Tax=Danio aesculapii TaxID=1142201 RepID=UPI0024C087E3|nr:OTU domain-containing protein 4 isoform X2 [Danio aesculapii]
MELRAASADAQQQLAGDRTHESRMDEYLRSLGFYRKKIAKDGSCLFRAVAEQILHCQGLHTQVRAACVNYLRQNKSTYELFIEGNFEKYLENLQDPQSWVGQVEISALAELYKHDFIIFQEPDQPPVNLTENGFTHKVRLCFLNGNHYDSVYPEAFEKNAAVCQSILYELLYERVCGVERNVVGSCVKGGRGRDRRDSEECKSSEESELEEDDFWSTEAREKTSNGMNARPPQRGRGRGYSRGRGREFLSTKVQKSLNPALYRNVEYDVWLRSKRLQQQRDFCIAAGMQYSVGDKCKVQLSGSNRLYNAYVKEVSPDNGPVTVFIEELNRQQTVPLLNLRLPSEEPQSWHMVSEKGKRHAAPNNEWESRGGRRPNRMQSQSTPSVRVHKQHSWPPQATPDDARNKFRRSDQRSSPVCILPEEEEESVVLELLHKDEHNFPSLGPSPQTATSGEVIKKGGEKKSSRKKEQKENLLETETSQRTLQRQKGGTEEKHGIQFSEEPGQRSSSTMKEKLQEKPIPVAASPPPPVISLSGPKTAISSSPSNFATSPGLNQSVPDAVKKTSIQPKSSPARNPDNSHLTPVSTSVPLQAISRVAPVLESTPSPQFNSGVAPVSVIPPASQSISGAAQISVSTPASDSTFVATPVSATTPASQYISGSRAVSVSTPAQLSISGATAVLSNTPAPHSISGATTVSVTTPASHFIFGATAESITTPSPHSISGATAVSVATPAPLQSAPALNSTKPSFQIAQLPTMELLPRPESPSQFTSVELVASQITPVPLPASTPTQTTLAPTCPIPASPIESNLCIQTLPPANTSTLSPTPSSKIPISAQVQVATPVLDCPGLSSTAHPIDATNGPLIPPKTVDPQTTMMPIPLPHAAPTSISPTIGPANASPPDLPQVSLNESVPPACETSTIPASGAAQIVEHPSQPQHLPFPQLQWSQLLQDPVYPGFPQNEKGQLEPPPPFSYSQKGEDLPKDMSVLKFFFNLGVKAYTQPMFPPIVYLAPLNQAYLRGPPPSSDSPANPTMTSWQPENPSSQPQSLSSIADTPLDSHAPIAPVATGSSPVDPIEVRGYNDPPSIPMHVQSRPPMPWSAPSVSSAYPGGYPTTPPVQFSTPPYPPPGNQMFPPSSVGYHRMPFPPMPLEAINHGPHGPIDVLPFARPTLDRGQENGQLSMNPQFRSVQNSAGFPGGQPHFLSGGEFKSVDTPVSLGAMELPPYGGPCSVPSFQIGPLQGDMSGLIPLPNGSLGRQGGAFPKSLHAEDSSRLIHTFSPEEKWPEEMESPNVDVRVTQSYYSQSYRGGGRRGQEERGGYRGRSQRGRKDYIGRGRQDDQSYRHYGRRGAGPQLPYQ